MLCVVFDRMTSVENLMEGMCALDLRIPLETAVVLRYRDRLERACANLLLAFRLQASLDKEDPSVHRL